MPASRRPAAGRRPAASRSRAARTSRPAPPAAIAPAETGRSGLTHRAAVLGLVLTTLVLSAALPVRELLDQRSTIAQLEQDAAQAGARVAELEQAKRQLDDPAHIASEARRRLHMARPGEVAYMLIDPAPAAPVEPTAVAAGPETPWWSQVWGSVQTADSPPPADDAAAPPAGSPPPDGAPAPVPPAP